LFKIQFAVHSRPVGRTAELKSHTKEIVTISDLSEVIKQALLHVLTPSDITGGCMVTEITLFNPNIITGNKFSAALVTDQIKRIHRKLQTL
jgi:hypothetical protein